MIQQKHICDRCKDQMDRESRGEGLQVILIDGSRISKDLCSDCYTDFLDFMELKEDYDGDEE